MEKNAWATNQDVTVSQCADKYRVLDLGASKPGQWDTDFNIITKDIMDSFGIDCIEEVWFIKPSQSGGTEAILNMLLYAILQDPGPTLIVEPTELLANEISQERMDKMILFSPELSELKSANEEETTKRKKVFKSMTVYFAWSGSPVSLASRPIKYVFFDEIDKYEKFSGAEASPLALAKERTNTYIFTRKLIYVSTPTLDTGYIIRGEKQCDARFRYFINCPYCGFEQQLFFSQVKWLDEGDKLNLKKIEKEAWYECISCNARIDNKIKNSLVQKGRWIDIISNLDFRNCIGKIKPRKIGFQINRLYSPWHSFGLVAVEFLQSKDFPDLLMNWRNSWMAEAWVDNIQKLEEAEYDKNINKYPSLICPSETIALTCGIDPGQGGYWFVILGWKKDYSVFLIQYGFLANLIAIKEMIWNTSYSVTETDIEMSIWRAGIDIGGSKYFGETETMTEAIYEFVRGQNKIVATKGIARPLYGGRKMKLSLIDKTAKGKFLPGGVSLWLLDSGAFKDAIYYRLKLNEEKGKFTFNQDTKKDFFDQLRAEEKRRNKRGEYIWEQIKKDNHYLDCCVIAFALADPECHGGLKIIKSPIAVKKNIIEEKKAEDVNRFKQYRKNWVTNWRT